MPTMAEPKISKTEKVIHFEIPRIKEVISDITDQNLNLGTKISELCDNMSKKFDRMERRMTARNDELVTLSSSLSKTRGKK